MEKNKLVISSFQPCSSVAFLLTALSLTACGGGADTSQTVIDSVTTDEQTSSALDITDAIFEQTSPDCASYVNSYQASVQDIQRSLAFEASVNVTSTDNSCTLSSDSIPNHDFNDETANFANNVNEINQIFTIVRNPVVATLPTALSQQSYNAVMLNGVVVDILSAGCYRPNDPQADVEGNVAIGCNTNDDWLLDPLGTTHKFGADQHNAHTQPDGAYHYHGNPMAMFDDNPGPNGSPVIGFAADGFPVYGSYFYDVQTGGIRKALSGYTLREGNRPSSNTDPGGVYDGTYIDDYAFTDAGDLDECNGMTVNGQYGYYVTDAYPWIIACYTGTPDSSFNKN